jgi:hypothetical protein
MMTSSIIRTRADQLATFRSVAVQLMEVLARWVPTTPEMEPKVLFGRHIWDFAQHADMLGKRTFELRAPLHFTLAPAAEYQALLEELSSVTVTADRIALLYQGLLPGLAKRYDLYLRTADTILDEPSVRVIERISADTLRMLAQSHELIGELPQFRCANPDRARDFGNREAMVAVLVAAAAGDRRRMA